MLKRGVFLAAVASAALAFTGCAPGLKDNTLNPVGLKPKPSNPIVVADLEVSPKKVIGQAKGNASNKNALEGEALALALASAPTSADVLVGAIFFYETSSSHMTVTAVGYPARYRNFRSDVRQNRNFFSVQQATGGHSVISFDRSAFTVKPMGNDVIRIEATGSPESADGGAVRVPVLTVEETSNNDGAK